MSNIIIIVFTLCISLGESEFYSYLAIPIKYVYTKLKENLVYSGVS